MATYRGTNGNDAVRGSLFSNNAFLDFGLGADSVTGGYLSDTIHVSFFDANRDRFNGGGGADTLDLSIMQLATRGSSLTITLGEGATAGYISTSYIAGSLGSFGLYTTVLADLLSIENITGSRYADKITGNSLANVLDGGLGNDTINAGAGNDTVLGGDGNDILNGGTGKNTVDGGRGDDRITHTLDRPSNAADRDAIDGGEGIDTLFIDLGGASYEKVVVSLSAEFAPSLPGFPGIGPGERSIDTGFISARHQVTSLTSTTYGEAEITGIENVNGSTASDIIIGDRKDNTLRGGGGDDLISGETGFDKLFGDAGNDVFESWNDGATDTIDGGSGIDTIDYGRSTKQVIVALDTGTASVLGDSFSFVLEDRISNVENIIGSRHNDYIRGDDGNNELSGRNGNDTIIGGAGRDLIDGGRGADSLTGGADADTFRFWELTDASGADTIKDFQTGLDKIDFSGFFSRQEENHWINDDATRPDFIGSEQFSGGYELRLFQQNGITKVQLSTGGPDFTVEIDVHRQVVESDFIF